jgi:RNA polymerase sigma factor (sigma-70 family)
MVVMGVQTLISQSDAELLAGTREDAEAFAVFYERWEAPILAWLVRRVREPELAADLSGEIFAAALTAADRFKAVDETGSAAAWLFTIARNTLRTSLRRGRVEVRARRRLVAWETISMDDLDLEAIAALDGTGPALLDALARLPASQRDAIQARVLDERDYAEIAGQLRCSELVARQHVCRGLRTLRSIAPKEAL